MYPMDRSKVVYRDVTQDGVAGTRANHAPTWRNALLALGFERVGLLEARLGGHLAPDPLGQFLADPDARLVMEVIAEGQVAEILTSRDRSTFAVIERWSGDPLVCLYTMVEDGIIVETTIKPTRSPQPSGPEPAFLSFRGDGVVGRILTLLTDAAVGTPPLWVHENWPRSGYHLMLVETHDMKVLWQTHRRRVDQLARGDQADVRPHNTLPLYLCIHHRARQIAQQKARWQERFSQGITLLFCTLAMAVALSAGQIFARLSSLGSLALFVPLFVLAVAGSLAILFIGFVRGTVLPRLPGPKLQPVGHLLAEVEDAYPLVGQAA